jgi:hypothetical protein
MKLVSTLSLNGQNQLLKKFSIAKVFDILMKSIWGTFNRFVKEHLLSTLDIATFSLSPILITIDKKCKKHMLLCCHWNWLPRSRRPINSESIPEGGNNFGDRKAPGRNGFFTYT